MNLVDEYFDKLYLWKEEANLLRKKVLATNLVETIKWGSPCYVLEKDNVVGIATFKNYVGLWFFQGALLDDKYGLLINAQEGKTKAMRQWRFDSLAQIQSAPINEYLLGTIENFKLGRKIKPGHMGNEVIIPEGLEKILNSNEAINMQWVLYSAACQREFVEYISQARKDETKMSRTTKVLDMMANGIDLNNKYKK